MTKEKYQKHFFYKIFWMFSSLKLAVVVIFALAVSLAAGTIVESVYDTPTSQYWIYRAIWFHAVLGLLAVNIFCVALSRYPWKSRHFPFLMAHVGILMLLAGSWMTEKMGVDGNLRVSEGETASVVELDQASLVMSEVDQVRTIPVPWIPPGVAFKVIDIPTYGLPYDFKVDRFLSHAEPNFSFVSAATQEATRLDKKQNPAIRIKIVGGPMGISEELWLWEGASGWQSVQAGPARFSLGLSEKLIHAEGRPSLAFLPQADGSLVYSAHSSSGNIIKNKLLRDHISGEVIHPGWKGNVVVTILDWIPNAVALTTYRPARLQYGPLAPSSAIHLVAQSSDVWLGLGDRAVLSFRGKEVEIGYFSKRFILPFSLRLERFTVEHDQGTVTPASYASRVTVLDGKSKREVTVSMNEPLELGGYTVYQASYEEADPRPVTSIFAVNRDPGRLWKYFGSLLIVFGSIVLFSVKYRQKKRSDNLRT